MAERGRQPTTQPILGRETVRREHFDRDARDCPIRSETRPVARTMSGQSTGYLFQCLHA
jgi:hypothetical protein